MPAAVSVVVPVFNGLPYLADAVDSIRRQTYPDLEIILVDGGSTDGSRDWIHQVADAQVRAIDMPPGTTAAGNWTAACEAATGEYVKLLCQDDLLFPDAIAQQVRDLESEPNAGMAAAQRDIVDARGRTLYRARGLVGLTAGIVDGRAALLTSYRHGTNIFGEPVCVLFRADALRQALPWDEGRPFLLDLQLYQRVLLVGPIVARRESVGAFRVSGSSWSTRLIREQTDQLRSWQRDIESVIPTSAGDQRVARLELTRQAILRRAAYRVLKLRGAFASTPHG